MWLVLFKSENLLSFNSFFCIQSTDAERLVQQMQEHSFLNGYRRFLVAHLFLLMVCIIYIYI